VAAVRRPAREEDGLGLVVYCRRCDEWWPTDAEFWRMRRHAMECRACVRERERLRYRRAMADPARREARRAVWRRAQVAYRARRRAA
jgi:hypothetical protein